MSPATATASPPDAHRTAVPEGNVSCALAPPENPAGLPPHRRAHLALLGLAAGFLPGFLGIGAGVVIVPVLMLAFRMPIKRAVATSLATVVALSLTGVLAELIVQRSNIYWTMGLFVTMASLLGSRAGARVFSRVPDTLPRPAFAAFLLTVAFRMVIATRAAGGTGLMTLEDGHAVGYLLTFAVGVFAGATSLLQILPTAGFGTYQHRAMGTVDFSVVPRLVPAGLVGAALGVVLVNRLPARPCQLAFAAFLLLTAGHLFVFTRPSSATAPARTS